MQEIKQVLLNNQAL